MKNWLREGGVAVRRLPPWVLATSLGVLLAVAAGTAFVATGGVSKPRPADPAIAQVDGRSIHLSEARARVRGLASVHGEVARALGPQWQQTVFQSLVDNVLVEEEADRRHIAVSDRQTDAAVSEVRRGFSSGGAFDRWLQTNRMSQAELRRRVRLNLLGASVYLAVTGPVTVTGKEIRDYYRSHLADFRDDGRTTPLLEVQESIKEELSKQKKDRAFSAWLTGVRSRATVVVLVPDWWRRL